VGRERSGLIDSLELKSQGEEERSDPVGGLDGVKLLDGEVYQVDGA